LRKTPAAAGFHSEVFETLSKIQTNHLRKHRTKAIFVHPEYWVPIFKCIDSMREHGAINSYGDRIKIPSIDDNCLMRHILQKWLMIQWNLLKKHGHL
jgi:predicted Rossmann-fold nucleotide-binding protein